MSDLFNAPPADPQLDETTDYLSELVGEGKKFKDAAALAKGKAEADLFIGNLQNELKSLRQELTNRVSIEQFLAKLEDKTPAAPVVAPQTPATPDSSAQKPLDPNVIEQMLDAKIREKELIRQANANRDLVLDKLKEAYGANYQNEVAKRATELSVTTQWLTELVEKQPQAFLRIMNLPDKPQPQMKSDLFTQAPPRSHNIVQTSAQSGVKNYAYYKALFKEDPRARMRLQSEMFAQAKAQGEAFFT